MSAQARAAIERARALVGTSFRPQGRDPETGLDCVGLVLRAFAIPEGLVRRDYRLTTNDAREVKQQLRRFFETVEGAQLSAGDVVLCQPRLRHFHLAIDCGDSFIHADAGLRRVVEVPGSPPWPIVAAYRATNCNLRSD